jgi:hypothetical protein
LACCQSCMVWQPEGKGGHGVIARGGKFRETGLCAAYESGSGVCGKGVSRAAVRGVPPKGRGNMPPRAVGIGVTRRPSQHGCPSRLSVANLN